MHKKQLQKVNIMCKTATTCKKMNAVSMTPHAKYDTACTIFAFENRSYLSEFEAELKKVAQGVLFDEKPWV
jgi:hypothetical protein